VLCWDMRLRRRPIAQSKLARARQLRRESTPAEGLAWELLRNRRMLGLKFRRQHVIAGFVADFYCADLRLVLEVDGASHAAGTRSDYDAARTTYLESRGLRVIRIKNDALCEAALRALLEDLVRSQDRRPPSPQRGEGARG